MTKGVSFAKRPLPNALCQTPDLTPPSDARQEVLAPAPAAVDAPFAPLEELAPAEVVQVLAVETPVVVVQAPELPRIVEPVVLSAPSAPPAAGVVVVESPNPLNAPDAPMPSLALDGHTGQFHAQDEFGQYTFGHYGGPNTRVETKDAFGRVSGSFAYVNPVGDVQVRKYAAAPLSGFRVAASDLVEETAEVAAVRRQHLMAHAAARALLALA